VKGGLNNNNMKVLTTLMLAMLVMSVMSPMALAEDVDAVLIAADTTEEVELEDAGITPDSPFYGLDNAMDRLRLALTFNKEKKAEKALMISEERLAEVKAMIEANKTELAEKAQERHDLMIARAEAAAGEIEADGNEAKAELALLATERVQNRIEAHNEKVIAVKARILARQGDKMTEEQIAHIEEVFGKIQKRMESAEENSAQRQETIRARYKALSGMSDSEIEKALEQKRENIRTRVQEADDDENNEDEVETESEGDVSQDEAEDSGSQAQAGQNSDEE